MLEKQKKGKARSKQFGRVEIPQEAFIGVSIGQKPISAIVDITNYVMIDINRPLHAYDADKIDKGIIIRNSRSGEEFMEHRSMCLITI